MGNDDRDESAAALIERHSDGLASPLLFASVWRPGRSTGPFEAWALRVAAGMLVLGGLIEVLQGGVVGRVSQFTDWLADGIGITLAMMVFASLRWALRVDRRGAWSARRITRERQSLWDLRSTQRRGGVSRSREPAALRWVAW